MTRRFVRAVMILVAALGSACAAPLGGEDIELSLGASALPGTGTVVGFSQRMSTLPAGGRYDLEIEWLHHRLDEGTNASGAVGDKLDQVRLGIRVRPAQWSVRAGVVWIRAQGDPEYLDGPDDYGGAYLGVGYEFRLGQHVVSGPDFTLNWVRPEGSGDSGFLPQIAWRFAWKL